MTLDDGAKNATLQGLANGFNGGANALLTLYIADAVAATFAMPQPIEKTISDGLLDFALPDRVMAIASGLPDKAVLSSSDGTRNVTFDVGTEITLDKEQIYLGGYVSLISLKIQI